MDFLVAKSEVREETLENAVTCCQACTGCLSRAFRLRTFDERKSYIQPRKADRVPIYKEWSKRFGRRV